MALFGKADVNLPILTQLYQLEGESEIHAFLEREQGKAEADMPELPPMGGVPESFVRDFTRWQATVRALLDARADSREVAAGVFPEVERLFNDSQMQYRFIYLPNGEEGDYIETRDLDAETSIPLKQVYFTPSLTFYYSAKEKLVEELKALLKRNGAQVIRCTECDSPFLVLRNGQRFCSHRCADRVSARRQRQAKQKDIEPS